MINDKFIVKGWRVSVWFEVNDTEPIIQELKDCNIDKSKIDAMVVNLESKNTGVTITSYNDRKTIMAIGRTTNEDEFINTLFHEAMHLTAHIANYRKYDLLGEDICYLAGDIGARLLRPAKHLICPRCRERRLLLRNDER